MHFTKEFITSLKQRISIEELIGKDVKLEKQAKHLVGLCPFHQETQPSFTVFPETQSFYCFGCGAGSKTVTQSSDHIAFLRAFHQLSFPQAVVRLAEITQTPLPQQPKDSAKTKNNLSDIIRETQPIASLEPTANSETPLPPQPEPEPISQEIFDLAAEFYHQQLFEPTGKAALDYLTQQRNRSLETIQQFKIGFAKGGRTLCDFLKQKNFTNAQLLRSGLAAKRGKHILDYFFGEILLFPHFKNNHVVGFTIKDLGRYKSKINLRLFTRDIFYHHDALNQSQQVILVEGESDLQSIWQFTAHQNVLALCGNSLTQPQLEYLLKAKITKVYLALDRDAPGEKATQKLTQQLSTAGMTVAPLQWHNHKDIDLWLRYTPPNQRRQAFSQLIREADEKSGPRQKQPHHQTNQKEQAPEIEKQSDSTLTIVKELFKTVVILLCIIFMLLKHSKTYIKQRKNPTPQTKHFHARPTYTVDALPVIEQKETVANYTVLLNQYQQTHGKPLKPVKRRPDKRQPAADAVCQFCGASAAYLSLNDGDKQVYCKICRHLSTPDKPLKQAVLRCPHCGKVLEKMKKNTEKNGYEYYKCRNPNCPYFLKKSKKKKKIKDPQKRKHFKKLHYIYRKPLFDITKLHPNSPNKPKVDLANVRATPFVVGLVCTYNAIGLSTREIATLMQALHQVSLSHQTVKNYTEAVAYRLAPLVFNYPYDLSGLLAADETYLRMIGQWGYLTWAFDPNKQIIAGFNISEKRNLFELAKAISHSILKLPWEMLTENAPFNPLLVTDGNPVYRLMTQFLRQANIFINHKVVIGLENNDAESADFRNLKQIIERLNKNFKKYLYKSEHFASTQGATAAAVNFVAYFNFIRKNSRLHNQIPVPIDSVVNPNNQPAQWVRLIEYAQNFSLKN
jgi:putative transposase